MRHASLIACVTMLLAACGDGGRETIAWRTDCAEPEKADGLGLGAARAAHRRAARRHEMRFREAAMPGAFVQELGRRLEPARVAKGDVCLAELADLGQLVFEHEFTLQDGLANGQARAEPRGPFRRVHAGAFGGPETISCPSCHWIGGPNGAGAETDAAFISGDGVGMASGDERNAPALLGLGVVQALAAEMTRDLQQQRTDFVRSATYRGAREVRLTSKGIDFGVLRTGAPGEVDVSGVVGVDTDLVVKPFGWKGTAATFTAFSAEAFQQHMGIQSDLLLRMGSLEQLGSGKEPGDPDGDGVRDELGRGPFAAMAAHLALVEMPIVTPLIQDHQLAPAAQALLPPTTTSFAEDFRRGRQQFHDLGCAGCHTPMLVLESPMLRVDGMPPIDLAQHMREPRLQWDAALGGYPVWLFSDLKRHDMGAANAARHEQKGVPVRAYLTPRLWGLADSGPYLHDGRAPSFDYAIAGHDGEGAVARKAFEALPLAERSPLRVYLMSLRRAPRVVVP